MSVEGRVFAEYLRVELGIVIRPRVGCGGTPSPDTKMRTNFSELTESLVRKIALPDIKAKFREKR